MSLTGAMFIPTALSLGWGRDVVINITIPRAMSRSLFEVKNLLANTEPSAWA